jgi:hypothetical protein
MTAGEQVEAWMIIIVIVVAILITIGWLISRSGRWSSKAGVNVEGLYETCEIEVRKGRWSPPDDSGLPVGNAFVVVDQNGVVLYVYPMRDANVFGMEEESIRVSKGDLPNSPIKQYVTALSADLQALSRTLLADGWEVLPEKGAYWYSHRYRRLIA